MTNAPYAVSISHRLIRSLSHCQFFAKWTLVFGLGVVGTSSSAMANWIFNFASSRAANTQLTCNNLFKEFEASYRRQRFGSALQQSLLTHYLEVLGFAPRSAKFIAEKMQTNQGSAQSPAGAIAKIIPGLAVIDAVAMADLASRIKSFLEENQAIKKSLNENEDFQFSDPELTPENLRIFLNKFTFNSIVFDLIFPEIVILKLKLLATDYLVKVAIPESSHPEEIENTKYKFLRQLANAYKSHGQTFSDRPFRSLIGMLSLPIVYPIYYPINEARARVNQNEEIRSLMTSFYIKLDIVSTMLNLKQDSTNMNRASKLFAALKKIKNNSLFGKVFSIESLGHVPDTTQITPDADIIPPSPKTVLNAVPVIGAIMQLLDSSKTIKDVAESTPTLVQRHSADATPTSDILLQMRNVGLRFDDSTTPMYSTQIKFDEFNLINQIYGQIGQVKDFFDIISVSTLKERLGIDLMDSVFHLSDHTTIERISNREDLTTSIKDIKRLLTSPSDSQKHRYLVMIEDPNLTDALLTELFDGWTPAQVQSFISKQSLFILTGHPTETKADDSLTDKLWHNHSTRLQLKPVASALWSGENHNHFVLE